MLDPEDLDSLFAIVQTAAAQWRDIGRELGFTMRELGAIVAKKGISNDQDYFNVLLDVWLNWGPPEKSFPYTENLLVTLSNIGQHRLAQILAGNDDFIARKPLIRRYSFTS